MILLELIFEAYEEGMRTEGVEWRTMAKILLRLKHLMKSNKLFASLIHKIC